MKRIAIFASGSGTNAENIIQYFKNSTNVKIEIILSNKKDAYVLERANNHRIKTLVFDKKTFYEEQTVLKTLLNLNIDLIVLAGFLLLVPENIVNNFENRIVNIHPALLPQYGGKGMYGDNVHKKVIENKEKQSGITIHFVNKKYDEGNTIFQAKCDIVNDDDYKTLAEKVHKLEYKHYPQIIEKLLNQ